MVCRKECKRRAREEEWGISEGKEIGGRKVIRRREKKYGKWWERWKKRCSQGANKRKVYYMKSR
jgi:hypothetical protein